MGSFCVYSHVVLVQKHNTDVNIAAPQTQKKT